MRRRGSHRQPNLKAPFTRGRTYGIDKQWTLAGKKKCSGLNFRQTPWAAVTLILELRLTRSHKKLGVWNIEWKDWQISYLLVAPALSRMFFYINDGTCYRKMSLATALD